MEFPVEAAVLDRRRDLRRNRRQQREIFAVERLVGFLAPEREDRDGAPFEHARHEIVDAGVAPEFDFLRFEARGGGGIVYERNGVAGIEPRHHR